jgi:hypothetical protein
MPTRNDDVDTFPIDWRHSRPLDVHTWSHYPEINKVVDTVFNTFSDDDKNLIRGRSNNIGRASGKTHLKVILLDLYVAWLTDPTLSIGVGMSNASYVVNSRYNALYISPRIRPIVHILHKIGFIDLVNGSNDRTGSGNNNHTTRIRAAGPLHLLFAEMGLEIFQIDSHHQKECIILKDLDTDEEGNTIKITVNGKKKKVKSKPVEYDDNEFTNHARSILSRYNQLLSETYIDILFLDEPFITRTNKYNKIQKIPINQQNKFVRRIFSRRKWDKNGRFYGGWWQQIPSHLRRQIAINNLPTVEVDYKGLHASILAAEHGQYNKTGDIYSLGDQVFEHFDLKKQRQLVKFLVLTAINAKDKGSAFSAFRSGCPTGTPEKSLKNLQLEQLLTAFINKHPYLEENLCNDEGIRLMFLDSQITSIIIETFTDMKKPILSIHDSYIVQTTDTDLLREIMKKASLSVVGVDLSADQQVPGYGDITRMRTTDRDVYIDYIYSTLRLEGKTTQYEERLAAFTNYRNKHHKNNTYWLSRY